MSFNEDFDIDPCNDFGLASMVSVIFRKSFDRIFIAADKLVSINDAGKSVISTKISDQIRLNYWTTIFTIAVYMLTPIQIDFEDPFDAIHNALIEHQHQYINGH